VDAQYVGSHERQHQDPADYPVTSLHSNLSP